jgi:hypothetical protein
MSTLATIKLLVKEIGSLSNTLADSVLKASKEDKIWSVMNSEECDTPFETLNRRFDALFGEDCCDSDGHMLYVCQGKLGTGLVVLYLSKVNWTGFPLDLVEIKLQRLVTELKGLQYVLISAVYYTYLTVLGEWRLLSLYALSTSLRSSRTRTMLPLPNYPSSTSLSEISILVQQKFRKFRFFSTTT